MEIILSVQDLGDILFKEFNLKNSTYRIIVETKPDNTCPEGHSLEKLIIRRK